MGNDAMTVKTYEQEQIYSLVNYHPYRKDGDHNPSRNDDTYKIMDLKSPEARNHGIAVNHFGGIFNTELHQLLDFLGTKTIQLAIIPSSTEGKRSKGLESILRHVKDVNLIYNPSFLVRTETIQAAHEGGERSIERHLGTIAVKETPDPNIPLIIFDDVATTGVSFNACKHILEEVGVKQIYMVAIGRTV